MRYRDKFKGLQYTNPLLPVSPRERSFLYSSFLTFLQNYQDDVSPEWRKSVDVILS